jgi:uncharacterized protein (TIGR03437 family)
MPDGVAAGTANITLASADATQNFNATVQPVAPSLFTLNQTGTGVAVATALAVSSDDPGVATPEPVFQCGDSGCLATPLALPDNTTVTVSLYATGVRNRTSLDAVVVLVDGIKIPVSYAGPAPDMPGLDLVNVQLTTALRGHGTVTVAILADGQISNSATITLQ